MDHRRPAPASEHEQPGDRRPRCHREESTVTNLDPPCPLQLRFSALGHICGRLCELLIRDDAIRCRGVDLKPQDGDQPVVFTFARIERGGCRTDR